MYNNIHICFNKDKLNIKVILEYVVSYEKKIRWIFAEVNNIKS